MYKLTAHTLTHLFHASLLCLVVAALYSSSLTGEEDAGLLLDTRSLYIF
ncbi:hypothetical protein SOVF_010950 [Spinacia oleracea]|nr:hypothetical protein SOVF_010950 [Spinacia oleracea]